MNGFERKREMLFIDTEMANAIPFPWAIRSGDGMGRSISSHGMPPSYPEYSGYHTRSVNIDLSLWLWQFQTTPLPDPLIPRQIPDRRELKSNIKACIRYLNHFILICYYFYVIIRNYL